MAELKLTPIQERFFLAIVQGKTVHDAFKDARFPTGICTLGKSAINRGASRMMSAAPVVQALARTREAAIARAQLTVDDLVRDLQEAREIALRQCDPPQTSGAVAATLGIAKLLGLVVDRKEIAIQHKPAISNKQLELGEDEWRRQFDPAVTKPVTKAAVR
jgi:hypothetical protein